MGKGGGCVPSKRRKPVGGDFPLNPPSFTNTPQVNISQTSKTQGSSPPPLPSSSSAPAADSSVAPPAAKKHPRIFIVFYSMYGHVELMARKVKEGVDTVDGVEGVLFRVPETLPGHVLEQMRVAGKGNDVPVIKVEDLVEADGLLFGFPTRFGSMAAQMKAFFDSTGELWRGQRLAGIPAGFFVSTGTQGGGQETTAWTAITQLAHHGMLYVPIGYTFGAGMFEMDSIRGGSPYGAGVFSGDGTRKPSQTELALAEHQGRYMATLVKRLGLRPKHTQQLPW